MPNSKTLKATLEWDGWIIVQGAVALGVAELGNISAWWAAPIALALGGAKSYIAAKAAKAKPVEVVTPVASAATEAASG